MHRECKRDPDERQQDHFLYLVHDQSARQQRAEQIGNHYRTLDFDVLETRHIAVGNRDRRSFRPNFVGALS